MRKILPSAVVGAAMMMVASSPAQAQSRYTLPAGTVILVHTETALQSSTASQGQTFETIVDETVGVDNYTLIPQGSRIRGVVSYVRPASRSQSGVIQVDFNRLTLSDGSTIAIQGKLTSTDAAERRQIESSSNQRVVLVGGRGGIGAAIAGAGSQNASTSNIFTALGQLLSEGMNVDVPAGTQLAVQLEQAVSLRGRAGTRTDYSLLTSADMIRAAQTELARQNYYRGTVDGQLTYATQRAIFEYQTDHSLTATGNLDWRTARSLGLSGTGTVGNDGSTGTSNGYTFSLADATTLRRNAQTLAASQRQNLSLGTRSRYSSRSNAADFDLWFALSAFADNASLYEQLTRATNSNDAYMANGALIAAARRVDTALQSARPTSSVRSSWQTIRNQLRNLDSTYY
jgi:peptidoglycan hydrolase-like protein with peptidoglycan-binding domain